MAHMTLSVPDELYDRFKRVKPFVNASNVLARGLEKEIMRMERVVKFLEETDGGRTLFPPDDLLPDDLLPDAS